MKRYFIVLGNNIVNEIKFDYLILIKRINKHNEKNESKYD